MVNIPYHIARLRGRVTRSLYQAGLTQIVKIPLPPSQEIPVNVFALSCERDLPEQVASIRSFIRYVGIPEQFTVISDGSYTDSSCHLLSQIHSCVKVVPIHQLVKPDLPPSVYEYAANNPMGKKLAVLLSIPIEKTTIYTDSDILFFPGAVDLVKIIQSDEPFSRYLPDCATKMDERVIYDDSEKLSPVNGGFIIFKKKPDWQFAMDRFLKLKELTHYFTEQTLVHLTMHYNQAQPLGEERYVLNIDDQFIYPDLFARKEIALRHYVSDIRHKFWFWVSL